MSAERAPAAKRHRADDDAGDANDAALPAPAAAAAASSPTRALEFYCGIGGLHYSLLRARPTRRSWPPSTSTLTETTSTSTTSVFVRCSATS